MSTQQSNPTPPLQLAAPAVVEQRPGAAPASNFEDLVHTIDAIIWEMDAVTWEFTFVSRRAEPILGYPVEQWFTEKNFWVNHLHPEDREWAVCFCTEATRDGRDHEFDYRAIAADGRVVWLRDRVRMIVDAAGAPRLLRGIMFDVTRQKEAEAATERMRRQNELLLHSAGEGIYGLDARGVTTFVNPVAARMLGWTAEELVGRVQHDAIHHSHGDGRPYPREACPIHATLTDGRERAVAGEHFFRKDGSGFPVDYTVTPIREGGGIVGAVVTFRDATARIEQEQRTAALAREQAARAEAEAARGRVMRILESITDAFVALDHDWRFTFVNSEAERVLRRSRDELLGRSIWAEFPEAVGTTFDREYRGAVREHRTARFQAYFGPLEGWFEVRAFPSEDGLSVFFRDVSERVRMDAELRRSEERYRSLVEATAQIIWDTSAEGEFVADQPAWRAFTGQTFEALRGRGWLEAVHPDDRAHVAAAWSRAVAEQALYQAEHRLRRHDGEYRHVMVRAVPVREPDGKVREWIGVHTDVSDRTRFEEERERLVRALDAERGRLQHLFQSAPALIALYRGPEHRLVMVNPVWERVLGRRAEDVLGRTLRELFPQVESAGLLALMGEVFRTGTPYAGNETPLMLDRRGDGVMEETFWNFVWQPLLDADGRVESIMVHAVEVTDQVRARQQVEEKAAELARLAAALEASNRDLDQFAYVASHDLRAPLRGIATVAQWLEEDLADRLTAESREHLKVLQSRVLRMEALIDGILQYSRAGRVRDRAEAVDVGQLLGEVVELLAPPATVRIDIERPMPTLHVERPPLQQVFLNLIGNAIKHAERPDVRVHVRARDAGDAWEFAVADDGPGVPPEYHDRIWGLFQTLKARDRVEGSGIGLSLVRKIIETRGGRIWMESEPGRGTVFRFTLSKRGDGGSG